MAACARSLRPDAMSAQAHLDEAKEDRVAANEHLQKFDPEARPIQPRGSMDETADLAADIAYKDYNPSAWNLDEARRHRAHALEHERAAAALESFESAECRPFVPAVRAACPFMGPISSVEQIHGGVRLHLAPGAPAEALAAHMRCHLAFALTRGFEVAECPLMLRGAEVSISEQGTAIDLTSRVHKTVKALRQRARALIVPPA
jgi:hypothetical protein